MKGQKFFSLLLALCLVVSLGACNQKSEQDKKFDELTRKDSSAADIFPESALESEASSASGESSEAAPTPEPTPYVDPEGLTGELTVLGPADTSDGIAKTAVEYLAEEFMKLHPGVKINVEFISSIFDDMPRAQRREQARSRILAELGSGEADYLLYSPIEELNIYGLSQSGMLLDLRPYFENDPSINPDDYYTQVLDAMSVDGKYTVMPFSFGFEGMMLNRPLMEEMKVDLDSIQAIDYKMLLDWYEQAKAIDPSAQASFGALTQEFLYTYEAPAYVDLENKTASFNSPEFIEFLTRTGALEEPDKEALGHYQFLGEDIITVEWFMEKKMSGEELDREFINEYWQQFYDNAHQAVAAPTGIAAQELGLVSGLMKNLAGPYPAVSTKGQLGVYTTEDFAIPATMKNPDLAWKFISYCISEREDMQLKAGRAYYTARLPINKKNFAKQMEFCRTSSMMYQTASYYLEDFHQKNLDADLAVKKLDEFLSMPLVNGKTHVIDMSEYLTEFYDSKLTTPEQCAEKIQGRMDIWLHE